MLDGGKDEGIKNLPCRGAPYPVGKRGTGTREKLFR
jgi:hypothetical protein